MREAVKATLLSAYNQGRDDFAALTDELLALVGWTPKKENA